ncbi:MAG: hypothetical protein WCD70_04455 [Alphaproteobacteria bacterium]
MVQEYRKIILSMDELTSALHAYRQTAPGFMPEGKITRCAALDVGVVQLTLEARAQHTPFTLRATDVLEPAIEFCIKHKIMLPREGQKSIEIRSGLVAIRIELNMQFQLTSWDESDTSTVPRAARNS